MKFSKYSDLDASEQGLSLSMLTCARREPREAHDLYISRFGHASIKGGRGVDTCTSKVFLLHWWPKQMFCTLLLQMKLTF